VDGVGGFLKKLAMAFFCFFSSASFLSFSFSCSLIVSWCSPGCSDF